MLFISLHELSIFITRSVDGASDSELLPVFFSCHDVLFFFYRAGRLQSITCCCIVFKEVLHARMKRGLKKCGIPSAKSPISRPLWRLQCETSESYDWSARYDNDPFQLWILEKEAKNRVFGMLLMVPVFFFGGGQLDDVSRTNAGHSRCFRGQACSKMRDHE